MDNKSVLFLFIFSFFCLETAFSGGIYLYEGKNGTRDLVAAFSDMSPLREFKYNFQKVKRIKDNKAKSAVLKYVAKGTAIRLYDSPKLNIKKHDWVEIEVKKYVDSIIIQTFEKNVNRATHKVTFHNEGLLVKNLDGKVSSIKVIPYKRLRFSVKPPAQSGKKSIDEEALKIVSTMKFSAYSHTTYVDALKGIYMVDCSGLLYYILKWDIRSNYEGMRKLAVKEGRKRPLAETVFNYIKNPIDNDWKEIRDIRKIKKGDVVVQVYSSKKKTSSTGHVMIVTGIPEKYSGFKEKKYLWYKVKIIDSARGYHTDDSREKMNDKNYPPVGYSSGRNTGVGEGFIFYGTDKNGRILCERWSRDRKIEGESGNYVIGRALF